MSNITISRDAIDLISKKVEDPAAQSKKCKASVPLLAWASRVTCVDNSGNRTEFGPGFYFSWSNLKEIEEYGYLAVRLDNGDDIALAPGQFFRRGSHRIDEKDGRFTLVSSD